MEIKGFNHFFLTHCENGVVVAIVVAVVLVAMLVVILVVVLIVTLVEKELTVKVSKLVNY